MISNQENDFQDKKDEAEPFDYSEEYAGNDKESEYIDSQEKITPLTERNKLQKTRNVPNKGFRTYTLNKYPKYLTSKYILIDDKQQKDYKKIIVSNPIGFRSLVESQHTNDQLKYVCINERCSQVSVLIYTISH